MQKELTISLSDETYDSLIKLVGEKNASQFIEAAVRPYLFIEVKNEVFKIHSPRLVDKSLIEKFKVEVIEETKDA